MIKNIFMSLLLGTLLFGCAPAEEINSPLLEEISPPLLIGESDPFRESGNPWPEALESAVMYEINIRQYSPSGHINEVTKDLPRLQELGVDILWLMPIHPISELQRKGGLGSYYSIQDYYGFNPEFGSIDDFDIFIKTAHSLGMKVILDLVINHTGWDHEWVTQHPDYYTQVNGEIVHPPGTDWTDVADLNHSNPDLIDKLVEMTSYWIREHNVDGYRVDVAGSVPTGVWREIVPALRAINPEVIMLAEDNSVFDWFDVFNLNYGGWSLTGNMKRIAAGQANELYIRTYLEMMHSRYPNPSFPLLFTTNHDMNSWEGTVYDFYGDAYPVMRMLTFTLPGMPLLYNGQESANEKQLAFFEKDLIPWGAYEETQTIQTLIQLKDENPALNASNVYQSTYILEDESRAILSFVRVSTDQDNYVLVIANLDDQPLTARVQLGEFSGPWNEGQLEPIHTIDLEPYEYVIYTK